MFNTIIGAIATIVVVTLILVALLLVIKAKLTPSGSVSIYINGGKKTLEVPLGGDLMHTLVQPAAARPIAASARSRFSKAAEPSFPPRPVSSTASRSRTVTVSAAR